MSPNLRNARRQAFISTLSILCLASSVTLSIIALISIHSGLLCTHRSLVMFNASREECALHYCPLNSIPRQDVAVTSTREGFAYAATQRSPLARSDALSVYQTWFSGVTMRSSSSTTPVLTLYWLHRVDSFEICIPSSQNKHCESQSLTIGVQSVALWPIKHNLPRQISLPVHDSNTSVS